MSKTHRTALGKSIDMARLRAKNENVRAVGNMSVNARGDVLDSHDRVINDANKRVSVMYQKTMQNPPPSTRAVPQPSPTQPVPQTQSAQPRYAEPAVADQDEPFTQDEDINEPNPVKETSKQPRTSKKT